LAARAKEACRKFDNREKMDGASQITKVVSAERANLTTPPTVSFTLWLGARRLTTGSDPDPDKAAYALIFQ